MTPELTALLNDLHESIVGTDRKSAIAARNALRTQLRGEKGIQGIGLGGRKGHYYIVVNLLKGAGVNVPPTVDGVPVRRRVVGRINKS